jgi:tRNA-splicing ligase RtcB
VECRKDEDVIDETPDGLQGHRRRDGGPADLVDVVHTLKQVLCVKG